MNLKLVSIGHGSFCIDWSLDCSPNMGLRIGKCRWPHWRVLRKLSTFHHCYKFGNCQPHTITYQLTSYWNSCSNYPSSWRVEETCNLKDNRDSIVPRHWDNDSSCTFCNCNRPPTQYNTESQSRNLCDWLLWTLLELLLSHGSLGRYNYTKYRTCWLGPVDSKDNKRCMYATRILEADTGIVLRNTSRLLWAQTPHHTFGMGIAKLSIRWWWFGAKYSRLYRTKQSSCNRSSTQGSPHPFESNSCQCCSWRKAHLPIWIYQCILCKCRSQP